MIAYCLMVPRYIALGDALDRQQYGLEVPLSDRHETEVRALHLPRDKIRRSRLAGAAGVLAFAGVMEVILVVDGAEFGVAWILVHDESVMMALVVLLGWFVGRNIYFAFMSNSHLPRPKRSEIDLLNLENPPVQQANHSMR